MTSNNETSELADFDRYVAELETIGISGNYDPATTHTSAAIAVDSESLRDGADTPAHEEQ